MIIGIVDLTEKLIGKILLDVYNNPLDVESGTPSDRSGLLLLPEKSL